MKDVREVLYVEDDEINAMIMSVLLRDLAKVDIASEPSVAITLANEKAYDLVLMDINLGHDDINNGVELMHQLKAWFPAFQEVPFFAVTAYAMPEDESRFLAHGFDAYFAKPVNKELLRKAVAQLS